MAIVSVRQAGLGGFTKNRRLSYTFPSTMGMVLLSPTSIAFSGTSASIGANGQVTFTAVTSLSLNGVFSATYDNYVIAMRHQDITAILGRLRLAGTDATGSNYTFQELSAGGTSVTGSRSTSQTALRCGYGWNTGSRDGTTISVYGPSLAQPTATRSISVLSESGAAIVDYAATHSVSTAYDGITLYNPTLSMTGALQVYGVRS